MKALSFVRKVFFVRARYRMLPCPEGVMVSETDVVPTLYGRQSPETNSDHEVELNQSDSY